jgi:ankyrin repeat protein
MYKNKIVVSVLLIVTSSLCVQADNPIHNSIYNVPYTTGIYNSNNTFVEDEPFVQNFNGNQDDLDVQDNISMQQGNPRHNSMLHRAVIANNIHDVKSIIENHKIDINYQNKDGRTALHYAAALDNSAIILYLLEHKAHLDAQDYEGWTPLHVAVNANAFDAVKILLEYHADGNVRNADDKIALDYAKNDIMRNIFMDHKI